MEHEYLVERVDAGGVRIKNLGSVDVISLNRLGKEGWKLVAFVPIARAEGIVERTYSYFVREKS